MIDTVLLTLRDFMFTINNYDSFEPSARGLYQSYYRMGSRGYIVCKQNPTRTEQKQGIYKPRLSITRRMYNGSFQVMLKIEFSAPKLIYQNNIEELEEKDFPQIIDTLQLRLKQMDVDIQKHFLERADVSSIHYSKNIPLNDGSVPAMYIHELEKADISKRYDINRTDFKNNGASYKIHTNKFEITFYDKFKDLQQAKTSEKRAEESDNVIQLKMFETIEENKASLKSKLEFIRMEVRINDRRKMRKIFKECGFDIEPTFSNLFKSEIAKKVLLNQLNIFENSYPKITLMKQFETGNLISQFTIENPRATLLQTYAWLGFHIVSNSIGIRKAREILKHKDKGWNRFLKFSNSFVFSKRQSIIFEPLNKCLSEFNAIKSIDFPELMINNDNVC